MRAVGTVEGPSSTWRRSCDRDCILRNEAALPRRADKVARHRLTTRFNYCAVPGLECCDKITDEGVIHIVEGLHRLTTLTLSSCYRLTDTGIARLG